MQKENLIKFCKNILIKLNMDADKAHATSEILVEADMMGHSTHGVRLLPNYVSDIEKGIMNVSGNYKIISEKKLNLSLGNLRLELKYNMLFVVLDVNLGNLNYLVELRPIEEEKSLLLKVSIKIKKIF